MTVSYQYEVASSTSGGFTRLLFMWRGSLYKLIYRELILFLLIFGAISAIYRLLLTTQQKRSFEQIVVYCDTFINLIPLSFVLGFYVAYVAGRWWQQYTAIPWPDKVMHSVALYVIGNDEYGRMLRRALMRYLNLSLILVLRSISSAVKRRFPTLEHVVDAGFMTSLELELFNSVPSLEFNTYWIPCTWFINLLKESRSNHRVTDPQGLKIIVEEFNDFRSKCGLLWSYDWVSIPLVYTQVVTLATYSFFAVALVGRQYIEGAIKPFQMKIDIYFPAFTVLQFFFFMGLLKVAEQLINPFGDDDEDFELNWLIDRHTKVSYLGVDILMNRCPPLVKDIYYDSENIILPYTEAAATYKRKTYRGSVANMTVPEDKQTMFLPNINEEEESVSSATPRTSSANLAAPNDSPITTSARQGGPSPVLPRKGFRKQGETIVTLDLPDETEQQQQQQQIGQSTGNKANGKSSNAIVEAVKMFTTRGKVTDLSRKPFFAAIKSVNVSIQPWPSATNLKSAPLILNSDWSNKSAAKAGRDRLKVTRSFNIPNIDVRQSSVDDESAAAGLRNRGSVNEFFNQSESMIESGSTPKRSSQAIFKARSDSITRDFLCREQSIEEEPSCCTCPRSPRSYGHASSGNAAAACCNYCLQRGRSGERSYQSPQRTCFARPGVTARRRPRTATRINSFPKFLAKRHSGRRASRVFASMTGSFDDDGPGLVASKSSPELRIDDDTHATTTAATAAANSDQQHRSASFFTGGDDDDDDDDDDNDDDDNDDNDDDDDDDEIIESEIQKY